MMQKILFIVTQSEFGGAQRFLFNLAVNLEKEKYHIIVAAGTDGNWELLKALSKNNIEIHKLKNLKRNINPYFDFRALLEIIKLIKVFRPEILFLLSSKAGIIGCLANRIVKIFQPEFNDVVIYRINWAFNDPRGVLSRLFYIFIERITAPLKDIILHNNQYDLLTARRFKIKPKIGFKIIYNGIDLETLNFSEREEARQALLSKKPLLNIPAPRIILGAIANFYKTKGLLYLIEAIASLDLKTSDFILILIGEGRERKKLEKLIRKKKLENKIFLLGQVPQAFRLAKAFDIFILSSLKEGQPWAILEAMAAKLPIIATKVGAIEEMLTDQKTGLLINPKDSNALAEAIKTLLINSSLRNELGVNGFLRVKINFKLSDMLSNYKILFQKIRSKELNDYIF